MKKLLFILFLFILPVFCRYAGAQIITTIAGTGTWGYGGDGGPATAAQFKGVTELVADATGNIYFCDDSDFRIRKIDTSGIITTFAGTGVSGHSGDGGLANAAQIREPYGIAFDGSGNLYFSEGAYIRKVNTAGIITTIAGNGLSGLSSGDGGPATLARIYPLGVCCDAAGNVYFGEYGISSIRKVDTSGIITRFAGSGVIGYSGDGGPATAAKLYAPAGLTFDTSGNLYIVDYDNVCVRKVNASGIITTIAGRGTGSPFDCTQATTSQFNRPQGVAVDNVGNIYIGDAYDQRVRKINALGVITTIAGSGLMGTGSGGYGGDGGPALSAQFNFPEYLTLDHSGYLYVTDYKNNRIRKFSIINITPHFINGHSQSITLCAGAGVDSINTLLAIIDSEAGKQENWSTVLAPAHGTLTATDTITSTGSVVTPTGLYYTPTTGYTGNDSFKVQVTDCGGIADTTTIYVAIVSSLSGVTISGLSGVCPGSAIGLTASYAGGAWRSSNTAIAAVGSGTGIVTGVAAGIVTISYSLSLSCGSVSATTTITVNPLPAAITGTMNVCPGSSTTLTVTTGGGTWSTIGTHATIGSTTGTVTGVTAGTSLISYTLTATGCATAAVVTVNPLPAAITGVATVCPTGSTTLTETSGGGVWSSSNTAIATVGSGTGVVSGVAHGSATITYAFPTGCISSVAISVNPSPAVITGTVTVCPGGVTTLSDTTTGGTWTSGSTGIASVGSVTGTVAGVTAGTATISYINSIGCWATQNVTVNPLPSPIGGPYTVCTAGTTALTETTTGGVWSSGAMTIATIGTLTGILTGIAAGTAGITYTLPTGCAANTTVTVYTSPSIITGITNVCVGSSTTLTTGSSGGAWSAPGYTGIASVGSGTGIVTGIAAGTAVISYTMPGGCMKTKAVTVNANPAAISGGTYECVGGTTSLFDTSPGGAWSSLSPGTLIIGSGTGFTTGIAAGLGTISYTLPTGCAASTVVTVAVTPTAINGNPVVCMGLTTALSDTITGGSWTSSAPSVAYIDVTTGVVTGVGLGTAIITYTLGSGCTATINVTVNSAPSPISGGTNICPGATTSLFDGVSGGVWSSGSPGIGTVGSSSGIVTGVSGGAATITYSMGVGCNSITTVNVTPAPGPISGTLHVCPAGSATLTVTGGGGVWSSVSTGVATIGSATGFVTGVAFGTTTISYTSTLTGCAATAIFTVNPLPASITGTMHVCPASSTTLTVTGGGGVWTSGSMTIATIGTLTGIVAGVSAGTVTITYTLPTGCSTTATVTVNPLPGTILGPAGVCTGATVAYADGTTGGTWSKSNADVNLGTMPGAVTGVTAGAVTISYTLPTGCYATKPITVNASPAVPTGTLQVCTGSSTTLTVTGGGGGWSSGSTGVATVSPAIGTVTGVSPGTAAIIYTVGTGCTSSATVTVNALPALFTVTGGGSYCAGGTGLHVQLSGSVSGVSYQLYNGAISVGPALGGTSGVLDFGLQTAFGTYTVIATTTATGCTRTMTGSATIASSPLPSVIGGPSAVCAGATMTETDSLSGGMWSSTGYSGIISIGSSSGVVTGISTGTAIITYTLPAGCSVTKLVTVSSAPGAISGASTVCAGSSTGLTVTPNGGVWTSSAMGIATVGSSSGIVTGGTPGTLIITYSLGTGCTVTKAMTVNASPAAITGGLGLCVRGSTVLTMTTVGGTWSSSAIGTATVGSSTGLTVTINGVAAGTAVITYALSTGCNATATVTVNALPSAITGTMHICAGSSTGLTVTTGGGVWTSGSTGIATVGSSTGLTATINGVAPGTSIITYSLGTGCAVNATVTVNALPAAITGITHVCAGGSTGLTMTTPGGTWGSSGTTIATIGTLTGIVTGVSAGTVTISYTLPTGCAATTSVTVNPLPSAITGVDNVCAGSSTGLTETTPSGVWSSSTGFATVGGSTGLTVTVNGVTPGVTTISYTLPTGCFTATAFTVNAAPAAIAGRSVACIGSSATLTDATVGGAWSSSATGVATIGSTGVVSAVSIGTTTISYTVSGCAAVSTFTVTSLPGAISGPNQVCAYATVNLTDAPTGGAWSSSATTIATIGTLTGMVTGVAAGSATITYSLGVGCTVTAPITVNPLPAAISGGSNICIGSSTTLADATAGGAWSSGATTIATVGSSTGLTVTITGVSGGLAMISYTLPTGCAATSTVSVTTVPPITGITNLCAWGDTMMVRDADTAGAYSSTSVTVVNLGGGAGKVTAFAPGAATITYTLLSGCGITSTLTVNPLPGVISGTTDLCVGGSTTLTMTTVGGVWSSSNPLTATIGSATGVVTAIAGGTAHVAYTIPTGCKTDTLVTVSTFPVAGTITGSANVCVGGSTGLTMTTPGGVWTSGSTAVATINTAGIVTGVRAGADTIKYSVTNVCGTASVDKAITIYPAVNAGVITGVDSLCAGATTLLSVTGTGGVWSCTNATATVSASGVVTGLVAGMDTVIYTVSNPGCTAVAVLPVKVLGMSDCGALTSPRPSPKEREVLRVWPNPSDGVFSVELSSDMDEDVRVVVTNVLGERVKEFTIRSNKVSEIKANLAAGVYLLSATTDGGNYVVRVVVANP